MAVFSDVLRSLGLYLKAQVENAAIVIALYITGFAVTGVPWWLLTGFVCGVLNIVPHLGPVLALGLALLVKWSVTDDLLRLGWVLGVWLIIQLVDGFVLSPRAAGRAGVNPLLSIAITLAGALFFGPIGMLLAVPVLVVVSLVLKASRRRTTT